MTGFESIKKAIRNLFDVYSSAFACCCENFKKTINESAMICQAENELAKVTNGSFVRAFSSTAKKICEQRSAPYVDAYISLCNEAKMMLASGESQQAVLWHFDNMIFRYGERRNKNE